MTSSTTSSFKTSEIYKSNKTDNQKSISSQIPSESFSQYLRIPDSLEEHIANLPKKTDTTSTNPKNKCIKSLFENNPYIKNLYELLSNRKFPSQKYDPDIEKKTESDKLVIYRKFWENENEFLMSCFAYCFCFESLYHIPYNQYYYGGIWFILFYLLALFIIGFPVIILEMGLGQFTGKGYTNLHNLIPLLKGIGYTKLISLLYAMMKNAIIGSFAFFYLFASFLPHLPWTKCEHYFNSLICSNLTVRPIIPDGTQLSSYEYYESIVDNLKDILFPNAYQINFMTITPKWHLAMGLLLIWFIILNLSLAGIKCTGKLLIFTVFYPIISVLIILSRISLLPGSVNGIYLLFSRPLTKYNLLDTIVNAFISAYSSLGLGYGGFITLSSMNNFRDNIYRNSLIIVLSVFLGHILFSLTTLCALGHLSYISNINTNKLIKHGRDYLFVIYPTILANLSFANLWMIIFMVAVLTIVINHIYVCFKICSLELNDLFVRLKKVTQKQPIVLNVYIGFLMLVSMSFVSPIGKLVSIIIHNPFDNLILPCLIFIPIFWISITYGYRQLQSDFKIMSFYDIGPIPFISVCFSVPILMVLIFCYNICTIGPYNRLHDTRFSINIIGISMAFLFLLPITNGIILEMIKVRISNPLLTFREYITLITRSKSAWGPRLKLYWIHNAKYALKLSQFDGTLSLHSLNSMKNKEFEQNVVLSDKGGNIEDLKELPHDSQTNLENAVNNKTEAKTTGILINSSKQLDIKKNIMKIELNHSNDLVNKSTTKVCSDIPDIIIDVLFENLSGLKTDITENI